LAQQGFLPLAPAALAAPFFLQHGLLHFAALLAAAFLQHGFWQFGPHLADAFLQPAFLQQVFLHSGPHLPDAFFAHLPQHLLLALAVWHFARPLPVAQPLVIAARPTSARQTAEVRNIVLNILRVI